MGKIVFIGDSITKGTSYGGVTTSDTFAHKIGVANGYASGNIINKGVNSDTSAGVLARIYTDVVGLNPDVCVLMIGVNDWATGVSLPVFQANLASISAVVRGAGIKLVVMTSNFQRGSAANIIAQEAYVNATESMPNDGVVDIFREMTLRGLCEDFLPLFVDAVHLTVAGHEHVANIAARSKYSGVFLK